MGKLLILTFWIVICFAGSLDYEPQAEVMQEQTTTAEEVTTEQMQEQETEPEYKLCDVDMDADLQKWIIDYCKDKHISPYIIMAMCERESRCRADVIGDSGNSIGIMQIQPRWHQWRMDKLGLFDWMDATQNIMIGIDILLDLYSKNEDTAWVLMAYNGGVAYANRHYDAGNISEYAEYIMARAEELEQMKEGEKNEIN